MSAGLCLAALPLIASVALADPSGNPVTRILAGGGSDTTQDVLNGLSNVPASGSRIIGSYDAVGSATIKTKTTITSPASDCVINRPVGSAAGVLALNAERVAASAPNPVRRPCLDFARSSADLSQDSRFNGAGLTFVPFAGDQVSYVTRNDSAIPPNLTNTQLRAIYECTAAGTINGSIKPLLPQSNSGTRAFFLKALGGGTPITPGACVSSVDPTDPTKQLIENTGSKLNDARHIAPYSVAQFNSQYYRVVTDVKGQTELRRINSQIPGSATFPADFKREVFNVIPTRNAVASDPNYGPTFVGGSSAVCSNTSVITQFGFSLLPAGRCGQIDPLLQTPGGLGPNPGAPTT